ncbi:MAG: hypothetical protein R3E96_11705 [Planctomycetota bacterium]
MEVEVLDGRRQHAELPITRVADTLIGTSAYMDRAALCRFLGEGETINGATMLVDDDRLVELHAVVKRTPLISGVSAKQTILRQIRDILEQNMGTFLMVSVFFSLVMAFGVLYNTVRITLAGAFARTRHHAGARIPRARGGLDPGGRDGFGACDRHSPGTLGGAAWRHC